jgi:hypothetical protein
MLHEDLRQTPFGHPEGHSGGEHPEDGELIDELSGKAERGVEVDRSGAHHHEQQPHGVHVGAHTHRVLLEQAEQERGHDQEQNVAHLEQQEQE